MAYKPIHKLFRGSRIIQWLHEESTIVDLEQNIERSFPNTTKRQYAVQPVQIVQVYYIPYPSNEALSANGVSRHNGRTYKTNILFNNVKYFDEPANDTITFIAQDNVKYNINPIKLRDHTVQVRCQCLDFYYRFATWNYGDDSLEGSPPKMYHRKTTTRPSVNPDHVPGVCKHILKLVDALNQAGMVQF